MTRERDDSKGPGEFVWFAIEHFFPGEFFPDEFWFISALIAVVFGLVWLVGKLFQGFSGND